MARYRTFEISTDKSARSHLINKQHIWLVDVWQFVANQSFWPKNSVLHLTHWPSLIVGLHEKNQNREPSLDEKNVLNRSKWRQRFFTFRHFYCNFCFRTFFFSAKVFSIFRWNFDDFAVYDRQLRLVTLWFLWFLFISFCLLFGSQTHCRNGTPDTQNEQF